MIEHFQREVDELNLERARMREGVERKRIEELKPEKALGYFVLEQIDRALTVDSALNLHLIANTTLVIIITAIKISPKTLNHSILSTITNWDL